MNSKRFRFLILISIIFLFAKSSFSQFVVDSVVRWKTVNEVMELKKVDPRPVMVFFYNPEYDTSMMMLNNVFNKKEIIMYVNPRFYCVKICATDSLLTWFDQKNYTKNNDSSMNDLIPQILGEKPAFPSLLFYNEENEGMVFKGFRNRYELRCLLVYFAEGIDKTTPFHLWYKSYTIAYPPINLPEKLKSPIQWVSLSEAMKLQKTKPKMLFINWYARLNVGSIVMLYNAFEDPRVAKYMNDNFYCIRMDAQTTDTLFWEKPYTSNKRSDKYHQLALEQLEGSMVFPSLLFFDKNKKLIYRQQSYLGPLNFYALANFVGSGAYLTKSLHEFRKSFKPDFP
jgi:thioredoxin-related protein